jgi:hypothetical protein
VSNIIKKVSLEDWIHEAITDTEKLACRQLSLVHVIGSVGGNFFDELDCVKLSPHTSNEPAAIAARFRHKAQTFAQDLVGVQTFCVLAFYGETNEPGAKHPFTTSGQLDFNGLATEGPTEAGQKQQNMRLTEAIVQGSFRQNATTFDMMIRMFDTMTRVNAKLVEQNNDAFEMLKEVSMARMTDNNDFQLKMHDRKMIGKMIEMAPALVNNMAGHDIFPENTADSALLEAIADELTPEKIMALQQIIPPKLWPLMANRFKNILAKRVEATPTNGKTEVVS